MQLPGLNTHPALVVGALLFSSNPPEARLITRQPMPTARAAMASAVERGQVFVTGGIDATGEPTARVEAYDVAKDSWSPRAAMREPRSGHAAAAIGGKIFVLGGITAEGPSATVDVYDPTADSWTASAPMPLPRWGHSAVAIGGTIYVVGGSASEGNARAPTARVHAYTPRTGRWQERPPLSEPRHAAAVVPVGASILVIGGRRERGAGAVGDCLEYDSRTGRSRNLPALARPRSGAKAVVMGDRVLALGGTETGALATEVEMYEPSSRRWYGFSTPGGARDGHAVEQVAGRVLIFGGLTGNSITSVTATTEELVLPPRDREVQRPK
jgi:N-acetylneuraminic acid mutarotase